MLDITTNNSSSKSRNKVLKYPGTEDKCATFDKLTAIETTDYLNGYYWSLDPDSKSLENPGSENIVTVKISKSAVFGSNTESGPENGYISKNGVRVNPMRQSSFNEFKVNNNEEIKKAISRMEQRTKNRYNRNMLKNIGAESATSKLMKLIQRKNKIKELKKQRKEEIEKLIYDSKHKENEKEKLDKDIRDAILADMNELEREIYVNNMKLKKNYKLMHMKERARHKEMISVPTTQEEAKEIANDVKTVDCLADKKRLWAGKKGLFKKNDIKKYFDHFDNKEYHQQLNKEFKNEYGAVQQNKKWVFAKEGEMFLGKGESSANARELKFRVQKKELNEFNSITYKSMKEKYSKVADAKMKKFKELKKLLG